MGSFKVGRNRARAVVANSGLVTSKDKGTLSVAIQFKGEGGAADGDVIQANLWLTDKAIERSLETLKLMGWKGTDDLSDLSGIDSNVMSLVVEEEYYEGESRLTVKWINDDKPFMMKKDEQKAAAAGLKDKIKAIKAGVAPVPAHTDVPPQTDADAPPAAPAEGEKDLPF